MSNTRTAPNPTFDIGGDLTVRRLGFGAMRVTGPGVWGPPADRPAAVEVIRQAVELGAQLIDTADSYGPHVSEELIAEAFAHYPEDVVIATKGGLERPGPGEWVPSCDPDRLKACCHASRERLGIHRIDLYQLHTVDRAVPFEDSVRALEELREDGWIRHVGLSNVSVAQIEAAMGIVPIATVQNRYSVADRAHEDVLDFCETKGIGFIPWFPLAAGELAAPGGVVAEVATELDASASQVALAWLLERSDVMLPIPGTSSLDHLAENLFAADLRLTDDQFDRIDAGSR